MTIDLKQLTMRVTIEIYQHPNGSLRLTEEINVNEPLTLIQAAKVLTKFSELAKEVQNK